MISETWWTTQPEIGADADESIVSRLQDYLTDWSKIFAQRRLGTRDVELRLGLRGLLQDEAQSFIAALDHGQIDVDDAGYVSPKFCNPKPGGGRYSLFSANTYTGDPYISLNTEYLIHIGAAAELVRVHGWSSQEVLIEVGEFDAACVADGRTVLVMEAKARVSGADSLSSLLRSFIKYGLESKPPLPTNNHSRKYVELLRLTESGSVILSLVAARARWTLTAIRSGNRVEFGERQNAQRPKGFEGGVKTSRLSLPAPDVDHACAIAALTEYDGAHRLYEYPWCSMDEAAEFRKRIVDETRKRGFIHSRPWLWSAGTSDGQALSPSGRDTGVEVRFSFYA
ncbi:MAG: hypothetical protein ACD_75C01143G0003 [uncultured bacterium]|nr:MAG: hypothetical protein ACD_75C01143G0003 [uncultured bacterium]